MTTVVNSRVRALDAVRRWTITGMVLAGIATAGVGAGLAIAQHPASSGQAAAVKQAPTAPAAAGQAAAVKQAPAAPAAAGTFGKVQPAQNAPAGAIPQTTTRAS